MLTDFQNSFSTRLDMKFVTKSYVKTPHPKRVATLPCEISMLKKIALLEEEVKQTVMQDLATQILF